MDTPRGRRLRVTAGGFQNTTTALIGVAMIVLVAAAVYANGAQPQQATPARATAAAAPRRAAPATAAAGTCVQCHGDVVKHPVVHPKATDCESCARRLGYVCAVHEVSALEPQGLSGHPLMGGARVFHAYHQSLKRFTYVLVKDRRGHIVLSGELQAPPVAARS